MTNTLHLLLRFFSTRIGINLTEENKKQEPKFYQKNDAQKSGKLYPKKSGINPEKVPKIMAHPHWSRHMQVNSLEDLRKCILKN